MKEWAKSHKEDRPIPEIRESLKKSSPKLKNKGSLNTLKQGEKEVSAKLFKAQIVEEEIWRLKSRSLWLKAGNRSIKFFHYQEHSRRI